MDLQHKVVEVFEEAFKKAGFLETPEVHWSDRPDLSDFQSNFALQLAKKMHQNPRELAEKITPFLTENPLFSEVRVDGPGFINVKIKDSFLQKYAFEILGKSKAGFEKEGKKQTIVLDYCGANVGKVLHVGHLRSAVIGEALRRLFNFVGDSVIGDVHLGDWGRPMGLVITEIKERFPDLPCFKDDFSGEVLSLPIQSEDLKVIYPMASQKAKEDENYLAKARENTRLLQEGKKGLIALWKAFVELSIKGIKENYTLLNVHPDLWYGESRVHQRCLDLAEKLKNQNILVKDEGAFVIHLGKSKTGKDLPPLIAINSEKAIMYALTDLATIQERIDEFNPDVIGYVTDERQALHFEQVFLAAEKIGFTSHLKLEHYPVGTINGKDNKPFKTRDGGVMPLQDLINLSIHSVKQKMEQDSAERGLTSEDKQKIASIVGISALKFADLMNDRRKNYIFDEEKLTSTEGRTGPYILYALVRIKSILEKLGENLNEIKPILPSLSMPIERKLLLDLYAFPNTIQNAYDMRGPHILCDYLFKLMQTFNTFYHDCPIKGESLEVQQQRISLLKYTFKIAAYLTDILGLEIPDKM